MSLIERATAFLSRTRLDRKCRAYIVCAVRRLVTNQESRREFNGAYMHFEGGFLFVYTINLRNQQIFQFKSYII